MRPSTRSGHGSKQIPRTMRCAEFMKECETVSSAKARYVGGKMYTRMWSDDLVGDSEVVLVSGRADAEPYEEQKGWRTIARGKAIRGVNCKHVEVVLTHQPQRHREWQEHKMGLRSCSRVQHDAVESLDVKTPFDVAKARGDC